MPRGNPPPSQKNRPIGFVGTTGAFTFNLRPEELTRYEPSRLAIQQTLAGAWIDAFDRGITVIKLSGTTGWHGGPADGGQLPGEAQFQLLRAQAFTGWHTARAAIVAGGGDPSVVQLYFVDTLNLNADLVAPKAFTLRRSKQRPLLMQYNIELLVLQDAAAAVVGAAMGAVAGALGAAAQMDVAADGLGGAAGGLGTIQ